MKKNKKGKEKNVKLRPQGEFHATHWMSNSIPLCFQAKDFKKECERETEKAILLTTQQQ